MINCRLERIRSNHDNMRADTLEGHTTRLPILGEPFTLLCAAEDPSAPMRYLRTTKVLTIETLAGVYTFTTRNSVYKLTVL